MAGTNYLYPFATGAGANVLSTASYLALTARLTGFQNGIALPENINSALRQACFAASMLGQFTADGSGQDVPDDGNVTTFEANFRAAILSAAASGGIFYGRDTGTADALVITPNPAATAYSDGMIIAFLKGSAANATTTPQINVNGLGLKQIVRGGGSVLQPGDLAASVINFAVYDGTLGMFRRVSLTRSDIVAIAGTIPFNITTVIDDGTGGADRIVGNAVPAITAYAQYQTFIITKGPTANATTTPYIRISGLADALLTNRRGGALAAGDLQANGTFIGQVVGTSIRVLGMVGSDITAGGSITNSIAALLAGAYVTAGGSANALTATIPFTVPNGFPIFIVPSATNTAAPTLAVNGGSALPITYRDGKALFPSELSSGTTIEVVPTGTSYVLVSPVNPARVVALNTTGSGLPLTLSNNVQGSIPMAGVAVPFGNYANSTDFVFSKAGTYFVSATATTNVVTSGAANVNSQTLICVNSNVMFRSIDGDYTPGGSIAPVVGVVGVVQVKVGDYLQVRAIGYAAGSFSSAQVTDASLSIFPLN